MKTPANRPDGLSSRVRLAEGSRNKWVARNGQTVDLPLIVDLVEIHPGSGECTFFTEARIELVSGQPMLVDIHLAGKPSLDPVKLQRFFRWATPVEIVRRTIPVRKRVRVKGQSKSLIERANGLSEGPLVAYSVEKLQI